MWKKKRKFFVRGTSFIANVPVRSLTESEFGRDLGSLRGCSGLDLESNQGLTATVLSVNVSVLKKGGFQSSEAHIDAPRESPKRNTLRI